MYSKNNTFHFRESFTAVVSGSSFAGKTEFVKQFIQQWNHTVPGSHISQLSIYYDTWQTSYDAMIDALPKSVIIETFLGIPENNNILPLAKDVEFSEYRGHPCRPVCRIGTTVTDNGSKISVIDDVVQTQRHNTFLTSLFSVYAQHNKMSTFLITQNIFNGTQLMRSILRNSQMLCIIKSAVAASSLRALQQQYFCGQPNYLSTCYRKIVAGHGNYMIIDLTSRCPDNQRVKTGIFRQEVRKH